MADDKLDSAMIDITLKPDGTYNDLRFSHSVVSTIISAPVTQYSLPVGLTGINRWEEIRAANAAAASRQEIVVFGNNIEGRLSGLGVPRPKELEPILDSFEADPESHFGSSAIHPSSSFIFSDITTGYIDRVRGLITKRRHHARLLSSFQSYLNRLNVACDAYPIAIAAGRFATADDMLALCVWLNKPRRKVAFFLNPEPINCRDEGFTQIQSQVLPTATLLSQIRGSFHLSREEVDTVFKVWNLSRRRMTRGQSIQAYRNVMPISFAQDLCQVISETYESQIQEHAKPRQIPAPIKFIVGSNSIELSHEHLNGDDDVIVNAAVHSLMKICDDLRHSATFHNLVPSFGNSIETVCSLLGLIAGKTYDDGTIVSLGLEMNALQWQIDGVREQASDIAMAQATALFSNGHLFMGRFPVWQSYLASATTSDSDPASDHAVSRSILAEALKATNLLTEEARRRTDSVLVRGGPDASAPALKQGVVTAAENLTAAIVNGISDIALSQKEGKTSISGSGATALTDYAKSHVSMMLNLATVKKLPWAQWATIILKEMI